MSRKSKYAEQVKASDVTVMQRELLAEFKCYVDFTVSFEKDAVRVRGVVRFPTLPNGLQSSNPVAQVFRASSSWTNPHLPFWCILSDIYDQLDRERLLKREIATPLAEGKLPW